MIRNGRIQLDETKASLCIYCSYSLEPVGYGRYRKQRNISKIRANQTKEILHLPQYIPAQLYKKEVVSGGDAPLRDIVVGIEFYIGLRGPGRVPGFSPWSSPIPPPILLDRCPPQLSHPPPFSSSASSPVSSRSRCDVHPGAGRVCPIQ